MRLYGQDADIWEVLRDPDDLIDEGSEIWRLLTATHHEPINAILELGCGCGPLACGFPTEVDVLLTDLSPEMLAISKKRNPNRRHLVADMRNFQLSEQFDVILIHDAIMYMTDPTDRLQTLRQAISHLKKGGLLLFRPDVIAEDFEESVICGGGEANGKTVALTEWRFKHSPPDDCFSVAFSLMIRDKGIVDGFIETHQMALLTQKQWREAIEEAGFQFLPCGLHFLEGPVFLARRPD